jgi:hypothetical protein
MAAAALGPPLRLLRGLWCVVKVMKARTVNFADGKIM